MYFKRMLDIGRDDARYHHKYIAIRDGVTICCDGIAPQKGIDQSHYSLHTTIYHESTFRRFYIRYVILYI